MQIGRRLFIALACLCLCLLTVPAAQAQSQNWRDTWVHTGLDLRPDPDVLFGTLPNGMRYAIQRNTTPPGQVSMRFMIRAGAMQEEPDQEGLAHFLEHMAFRGSTHIPDSEVKNTLERIGLRHGGDSNAFTNADRTYYTFDLPKNDEFSLRTGLTIFREIATELTLSQEAMNTERAVVAAEGRSRAGAGTELLRVINATYVGVHPYARLPIGRPDVVANAPVSRVRDYYDAYYRPERATLIVAGDIDPDAMETRIKAMFGDWQGRGVPGQDPGPAVIPAHEEQIVVRTFPGLSSTSIQLIWNQPYVRPTADRASFRSRLVERISEAAFSQRLNEFNLASDGPYASGQGLTRVDFPGVSRSVLLDAQNVRDMKGTFDLLIKAQRQALEYGFTQEEIDRLVESQRASSKAAILRTSTRLTSTLANGLMAAAVSPQVYLSARQQTDLLEEMIGGITLEEINAAFRSHFAAGGPTIIFAGPQAPPGGEAGIRAVLSAARAAPVNAYTAISKKPWIYTDFGPPGRIAERRIDPRSGATMLRFSNNVRLTIRSNNDVRNEVMVKVRFGHGALDLPRDRPGPGVMGPTLLANGGLRDMTLQDRNITLQGRSVGFLVNTVEDAFEITPSSAGLRTEDLELEMQLIAATITQAAYRSERWNTYMDQMAQNEASSGRGPETLYQRLSTQILRGGDQRWAPSTTEQRQSWTPDQARAFIQPIVETAPLEVIITGDVTIEAAIKAVAGTLGALPARPDKPEPAGLRAVRFPAPGVTRSVLSHRGNPNQALVTITWPASDAFEDTRQTQAASVLADILRLRLYERIRVRQGLAYSPSAASQFSRTLPGYGMITLTVGVQISHIEDVYASLDAIAAELAAEEVSADELERARAPRLEGIRQDQRQNDYWLYFLGGSQTDGRLLNLALRAPAEVQSLTPADIRAAARRWLVPEKALKILVAPEAYRPG